MAAAGPAPAADAAASVPRRGLGTSAAALSGDGPGPWTAPETSTALLHDWTEGIAAGSRHAGPAITDEI